MAIENIRNMSFENSQVQVQVHTLSGEVHQVDTSSDLHVDTLNEIQVVDTLSEGHVDTLSVRHHVDTQDLDLSEIKYVHLSNLM